MIRIGPGVELLDATEASLFNELMGSIAKIRARYDDPR